MRLQGTWGYGARPRKRALTWRFLRHTLVALAAPALLAAELAHLGLWPLLEIVTLALGLVFAQRAVDVAGSPLEQKLGALLLRLSGLALGALLLWLVLEGALRKFA